MREHFGSEKIYVINDYKYSRDLQADNIYHVKTTVSDLKDSDFALAALEKNLERLEKEIKEEATKKTSSHFLLISLLLGATFLALALITILIVERGKDSLKKIKNIK